MRLKILIIGFGSIGKRHYRNLLALGYKDVKVYDPSGFAFSGFGEAVRVKSLSTNEVKKFQVVFICSPNNLHLKQALICAQAGCHVFIEKPLSHNLTDLNKLIKICEKMNVITMVGCNMRFHPCLQSIKDCLDKKLLGRVYSIQNEFGYYLPNWRPDQDYSKNYAAKNSKGGGIILDDIHEFDLLFWLNNFEKTKEAKFIYDKVSDLKIETEDICLAAFKFKNKVLGLVKSDYLQQDYSRNCKIIGEKGNLEWNYSENIVWLKSKNGAKRLFGIRKFDPNRMYLDEAKYFFQCLAKKVNTFNNVSIASDVLKNILTKKSKHYE